MLWHSILHCVLSYLFPPCIFPIPSFLPFSIPYKLSSPLFIQFMFIFTFTVILSALIFLCFAFFVPSVLRSPSLSFNYFLAIFLFSFHYYLHTFLFYVRSFQAFFFISSLALSFLFHRFNLSFFLSYVFTSRFSFLFLSLDFPFLFTSFNFYCLSLLCNPVIFHFSHFFFLVPSFRLLIYTFFPYFIFSLVPFIHSTLFLRFSFPSLCRYPTTACSISINNLPYSLNHFSSITKETLIFMCKQQSADPGGRVG